MNELKFLEVMGKIDNELIREAEVRPAEQPTTIRAITKRRVYAFGSVAAVAAIAVGAVMLLPMQKPSDTPVDHAMLQQDSHQDNAPTAASMVPASSRQEPSQSAHAEDPSTQHDNSTAPITESQSDGHIPGKQSAEGYYQPFSATVDPDSDSYGEDEMRHIDVRTAEGFYRQLGLDEYAPNGLAGIVSTADFGEYIGTIREVTDSDYHGNMVESQEPTLAGAEVYCYAPKGRNKAFIIVKKGGQCSIFMADGINTSEGFRKGLTFFNVQGAENIECVTYEKYIPDDEGQMLLSERNILTSDAAIGAFYALICQLQPEDDSYLPAYTATPQWLIDAWEDYKAAPDAPAREDYDIVIQLKDGTVLRSISYQPYLGNGYVEHMQELTPEQNRVLKNLLR